MENDLSKATVGTLLRIVRGIHDDTFLERVERVTPSGLVVTKSATFRVDGVQRQHGSVLDRCRARIATEEDIADVRRNRLIRHLRNFAWEKLSAEHLKVVGEIVKRYSVDGKVVASLE